MLYFAFIILMFIIFSCLCGLLFCCSIIQIWIRALGPKISSRRLVLHMRCSFSFHAYYFCCQYVLFFLWLHKQDTFMLLASISFIFVFIKFVKSLIRFGWDNTSFETHSLNSTEWAMILFYYFSISSSYRLWQQVVFSKSVDVVQLTVSPV